MKIAIVGTGYVGLITGTVFAFLGNDVTCVDVDKKKIENLVNGIIPIYEPGLDEMIKECIIKGRLHFTTELSTVVDSVNAVFSAVGTPPAKDGSADLSYVYQVAKTFGENISHYNVFVTKSTVPVGTADKVKEIIQKELDKREMNIDFDVVSNPEFLREGSAIKDCLEPDRIVIGTESERAKEVMRKIYSCYYCTNDYSMVYTDLHSAEMIKYASNSMLATRISFINEISRICEQVGADIDEVAKGVGMDTRIGKHFLNAGCGYGGSCFPKDVQALISTAKENKCAVPLLEAVENTNTIQKNLMYLKVCNYFRYRLDTAKIAIWGLSFKPDTDDMRQAPSLKVLSGLWEYGAKDIRVYDPVAMEEGKKILGDAVKFCNNPYETAEGADVIIILTEWKEFRMLDMDRIRKSMKKPVIFDGRNIYSVPPTGFEYYPIGKIDSYKMK